MTDTARSPGEIGPLLTTDDGTEVTVRHGVMFKDGTIAVQVYDRRGEGATAYLNDVEATVLRDALDEHIGGTVSRGA